MSTRQRNTRKRHQRIREEFRKRYTDAPKPRKYSREYIVAQLAEEYDYSMRTIEDIVYTKPDQAQAAA